MQGGLKFQDQSAFDLCLSVIEGGIDPNLIQILRSETFQKGTFSAHLHIIGASHAAIFAWPDVSVSEMFACAQFPVKGRIICIGQQERKELEFTETTRTGIKYSFRSQLHFGAEGISLLRCLEGEADEGKAMAYEFPDGDLLAVPKTILALRNITESGAKIVTAHFYPNEGVVVSTDTQIERIRA